MIVELTPPELGGVVRLEGIEPPALRSGVGGTWVLGQGHVFHWVSQRVADAVWRTGSGPHSSRGAMGGESSAEMVAGTSSLSRAA